MIIKNIYYFVVALTVFACNDSSPPNKPANLPAPPSGIQAERADQSVTLTWDPVDNVTSYNIYHATVTGITPENYSSIQDGVKITDVTSAYTINNLINNQRYYFVVTSVANGLESTASVEINRYAGSGPTVLRVVPDSVTNHCTDTTQEVACPTAGQFQGQDGDYTINAPSYTADAEIVNDQLTGLTWELNYRTNVDHATAATHCQEQATANFAGISTWRLPTFQELISILDMGKSATSRTFSPVFPANPPNIYFWTSDLNDTQTAAYVLSGNWGTAATRTLNTSGPVRCVSGTLHDPDFRLENNGNVVEDWVTGLYWQRDKSASQLDWQASLSYCEALVLDGYQDWRLPNYKELLSIVVPGLTSPVVSNEFINTPGELFWSSTITASNPYDDPHAVNFAGGTGLLNQIHSNTFWARCVRGTPVP